MWSLAGVVEQNEVDSGNLRQVSTLKSSASETCIRIVNMHRNKNIVLHVSLQYSLTGKERI